MAFNQSIRSTAKQDWSIGQTVKVGFMTLEVVEKIPTSGDYRPDQYRLVRWNGAKATFYRFTPHYGLERELTHST